MVYNVAVKIVT